MIKLGLTPNVVTTIGFVLNLGVAVIFIVGAEEGNRGDLTYIGWAGALILFAGLFDMLDGQVARLGNMKSTFGALYDSVLDRYSELVMFLGYLPGYLLCTIILELDLCICGAYRVHDGELRKSAGRGLGRRNKRRPDATAA